MKRPLIRLLLVAVMLCDFLGAAIGARADGTMAGKGDSKEQLSPYDGYFKHAAEEPQTPLETALRTSPTSQRVASPRPARLLPTNGGKPTTHPGRWACGHSSNLLKHVPLRLCRPYGCRHTAAASPRLYYVIALRRLLC